MTMHFLKQYKKYRQQLVQDLWEKGITDQQVLKAIRIIPRHLFLEEPFIQYAYEDQPLPIGYGQTISQPYIVALMTQSVCQGKRLKSVLEIGTGCGYQAAILACLAEHVYSIERIAALTEQAQHRLNLLSIPNVTLLTADGYRGWPEHAPYAGILITAALPEIPEPLLHQLSAHGGRLVAPQDLHSHQQLVLIQRHETEFQKTILDEVRFVPFLRGIEPHQNRDL